LMPGSLGILGVICEVSLKVLPKPLDTATLSFDFNERQALEQLGAWSAQPLAVNATAWHSGELHVRLAGARAAVASAVAKLGGTPADKDRALAWWVNVRDQAGDFFALSEADGARGESLWRLSVPATSPPLELTGRQFIEWHGAQRWWKTMASAAEVRAAASRAGGHATLMRGVDRSSGVFTPLNDVLMRIHRGLKLSFDPARIFNPGRLYAGL
jgi:glycolate oxidase FAD binding subunit